jgi:hypothetical protein
VHADTVLEREAIEQVTGKLTRIFADVHTAREVIETVASVHRRFEGSPVRDFVPLLVERFAREELKASSSPSSRRKGSIGP